MRGHILTAGAPFVLHRGADKHLRHVWVADAPQRGHAMLRWQSNKGVPWRRLQAAVRTADAKANFHEAPVPWIASVTYGEPACSHARPQARARYKALAPRIAAFTHGAPLRTE